MAIITISRPRSRTRTLGLPALPPLPLAAVAFVSSTLFFLLFADAMLHERAFFDAALLQAVQSIEFPGLEPALHAVNTLTSSTGAIAAWALILTAAVVLRWWVPAMAVVALPIAGAVNWVAGEMAGRTRPADPAFERIAGTTEASFPSGHVMGAVMLYGLVFVLAGRFQNALVRNGLRLGTAGVLLSVGPARVWDGAHWPSDVLGAYTLGALLLTGLLAVYLRAERAWAGLPLVRQGTLDHDEATPHAHALTSLVVFRGTTVAKIYSPGLLPRALYWLAFQAPFPYIANRDALQAAVARRNLAGMLTAYWYGESRVARALGIEEVSGHPALVSEFVQGHAPSDPAGATAFLRDLRSRFEAAGLPTWQIDPRQPRAVDNALEVAPGRYVVVDLESGLVAPIASPRIWLRAIRRGMVPLFDDVHTDITRAYVAREAQGMRAAMGDDWFAQLHSQLDEAETTQAAWRADEPRLIGRFVGGFWSAWNYRAWPARFDRVTARGRDKADRVLEQAIASWERDGRVSPLEAAQLRTQVASAEMRALMPHLGAHGVITLFLRFPFGSITRPAWSLVALLYATGRLAARKSTLGDWKQAWTLHSPVVIALSAIPGFGAFAYLAARPVRRNRLLVRAVFDSLALKVPARLYERSGARLLIARRASPACEPECTPRTRVQMLPAERPHRDVEQLAA